MKFTMKLWDRTLDKEQGPWLRSKFRAIVFNEEGANVATLHTDDICLVNALARRFVDVSGQDVRLFPLAFNVVSRRYYDTTSGRGLTYAVAENRGDV